LYQTLEYKRLDFVPLKTVKMDLMVGATHPLYGVDYVEESELKNLRFVQYNEEYFSLTHHIGHLNESLHRFGKLENIVTTNSDAALLEMVYRGGLCHLGSERIEGGADNPMIRHIPIRNTEDEVNFGYIKRSRDGLSSLAEDLIRYVKQEL
jgi:DNA-binding transcriptional LysR family regulator